MVQDKRSLTIQPTQNNEGMMPLFDENNKFGFFFHNKGKEEERDGR